MPKPNTPYDPQPERQDALGELAREGYDAVKADHASRLTSIQDRLGLPVEDAAPTEAIVRSLRPRRWLAVAAGVAALVVAGVMLFTYESPQEQFARAEVPAQQAPVASTSAVEESSAKRVEGVFDEVALEALPTAKDAVEKVERVKEQVITEVTPTEEVVSQLPPPPSNRSSVGAATGAQNQEPPIVRKASEAAVSKPMAEIPPSAPEAGEMKKESTSDDAGMLSDEVTEVVEDETAGYRMERAPSVVETRELSGEVLEPSGVPVVGAMLTVEETGQQVVTDQKGEFTIQVTSEAIVGEISAEGYSDFLFDLTAGEEYRVFLPRISSSLPTAHLKGKSIGLRIIAPKADHFAGFDDYISTKQTSFSGESVSIQFEVNKFGRPRQIVSGPGRQNRDAIKVVKDWLKNGPNWPETYQRKSWRYEFIMP